MILLIVLHICFLLFYLYVQNLFEKDKPLYSWFYTALVYKVLAGLGMGALYIYYYSEGDITVSYSAISRMAVLFYADFDKFMDIYIHANVTGKGELLLEKVINSPRQWFFVKLMIPVGVLIDNYWMLNVYTSVFSFMGLWNLANRIVSIFPVSKTAVLISFFLFPSVVFWSSGMIKEAVLLGSIGFCMSFYLKWVYEKQRPEIIESTLFLICLWIILNIKYYIFSVLFFLLVTHFVHRMVLSFFPWLRPYRLQRIAAYYVLLALLGLSAGWIHPNLSLSTFYQVLLENYSATIKMSQAHNVFHLYYFEQSVWGLLLDLPKAFLYGLFGPLWNFDGSTVAWLSVVENVMLILIFGYFIYTQHLKKWSGWTLEYLIIVNYVLLLACFLTFASPNWGSLVRYKVSFMPLLLLLLLGELPFIARLDLILFPEVVKETEKIDTSTTTDL
jgi:hypothetical protein